MVCLAMARDSPGCVLRADSFAVSPVWPPKLCKWATELRKL